MEPDRRNLLENFDDPPTSWRGLFAGLLVLLLLLAGITSWDLILTSLRVGFEALAG